jgi:hypothetical protein
MISFGSLKVGGDASPMLRAYRLVYDFSNFGPPQLWEWQQPYIDHLVLNATTFG